MRKIILIALLVCIKQVNAQTYVAIPDSNFVHYLKTIVPTAFKGDSLNTSNTLVTTTTHNINVNGLSITNLSGVQYFTSLTNLSCSTNSLTNLPALPNSLINLSCQDNSLTSLPALPNSLNSLSCNANHLTSLPSLPNLLQSLDCDSNILTSLPSLPNSLNYLSCNYNSLTSLPALPNAVSDLYCAYNQLTNLPALPNSLWILDCWQNSLTSLPTLPNSVNYIYCAYNQLASLPALPNSLIFINCMINNLTSLPTLPNGLQSLFCLNNNISCFPIFPNSITAIDIDPNPYNCLPNYVLPAMNSYTITPFCVVGNTNSCPVAVAGMEHYSENNSISIYPNPTKGIINVELKIKDVDNNTQYTLYDINGNAVKQAIIYNPQFLIDATDLAEGVYNISIISNEGVVNKRLVIVR